MKMDKRVGGSLVDETSATISKDSLLSAAADVRRNFRGKNVGTLLISCPKHGRSQHGNYYKCGSAWCERCIMENGWIHPVESKCFRCNVIRNKIGNKEVIKLINLGTQINESKIRFSWYDTSCDEFMLIGGEYTWESWEDFVGDYKRGASNIPLKRFEDIMQPSCSEVNQGGEKTTLDLRDAIEVLEVLDEVCNASDSLDFAQSKIITSRGDGVLLHAIDIAVLSVKNIEQELRNLNVRLRE